MAKGNKRGHQHAIMPDGLIARIRLKIKSGGYNDPENGGRTAAQHAIRLALFI